MRALHHERGTSATICVWSKRRHTLKFWQRNLDNDRRPTEFHELQQWIIHENDTSFHKLEHVGFSKPKSWPLQARSIEIRTMTRPTHSSSTHPIGVSRGAIALATLFSGPTFPPCAPQVVAEDLWSIDEIRVVVPRMKSNKAADEADLMAELYMISGRIENLLDVARPEKHGLRTGRRIEAANLVVDKTLAHGFPMWIVSVERVLGPEL